MRDDGFNGGNVLYDMTYCAVSVSVVSDVPGSQPNDHASMCV